MPIFEFQCNKCDNIFEEVVFGDDAVPCPQCSAGDTEKLISRPRRTKVGGGDFSSSDALSSAPMSSGGGCAGCSGGSCGTCGQ